MRIKRYPSCLNPSPQSYASISYCYIATCFRHLLNCDIGKWKPVFPSLILISTRMLEILFKGAMSSVLLLNYKSYRDAKLETKLAILIFYHKQLWSWDTYSPPVSVEINDILRHLRQYSTQPAFSLSKCFTKLTVGLKYSWTAWERSIAISRNTHIRILIFFHQIYLKIPS